MKLSTLTGPLGEMDNHDVELHVRKDGQWHSLGKAALDPDAWVATFRITGWDEKRTMPYKVIYHESLKDGSVINHEWSGSIHANPVGRPLRMAALTCQNDYAFPYAPVANNLVKLQPDLLFFSGDQIYESHGGFGIIRDPADLAILCYLRKYYQFGWAFREAMRHAPTLCLPDDHDVFQGNLWGDGGKKMQVGNADSGSGYLEPARMVNAVHKTTVAHHPDPYDPTPVEQGITTYYGDMVYGGVGFAIIADRQWKSGPSGLDTGGGRQDHVEDKDFDTSTLDKPGLVFLGERQEKFLEVWAKDWRGHTLKAVLSQTVFAGMATHHGNYNDYLKADLDCGGWPQSGRNRAISAMRPSMALHINGDQHLGSLVQYGVDRQRDSNWAFCTPAIAAGYARWWRPDEVGMPHANRPAHGLPHTGEYLDGLGNKVYVHAVENPQVGKDSNRYQQAHEKGSGFGFITFDTGKKTYFIESYRFLIDATDGKPSNLFNGWPATIHQRENGGESLKK
jgi:alkaline phosphatase D